MNRDGTHFFFTPGGCASCLRACLGARLLPQSYQYPNLSEGADRISGQLRGDKESPFSGVTKSGRVLRKVPENDARSVDLSQHSSKLDYPPLVLQLPICACVTALNVHFAEAKCCSCNCGRFGSTSVDNSDGADFSGMEKRGYHV